MNFRIRIGAEPLRHPQPKSISSIIRILKSGTGALLADSMGLGKSADAIIASATTGDLRVCVLGSKSSLSVWQREIIKWHPNPGDICIYRSKTPWRKFTRGWALVNYDILGQLAKILRAETWDLLIIDESQMAKEPDAKRTKLLRGGDWNGRHYDPIPFKKVLFISGTPFKNRIEEMFEALHIIDPAAWPNRDHFVYDYYEPQDNHGHPLIITRSKRVVQNVRTRNLTALHRRIKPFLVRTHKDDILGLPPKRFEKIYVPMMDVDQAGRFDELTSQSIFNARMLKRARQNEHWEEAEELEKKQKTLMSLKARETIQAKRKVGLDILLSLPEGKKVVVIGFHRDECLTQVANALRQRRGNRAVIEHNGDNSKDADDTVRKFQTDPNIQFFIGQLNVSNLSLTLTAAEHIMFLEIPNTWTDFDQAVDRVHRYRPTKDKHGQPILPPEFIQVTVLSLDYWGAVDDGLLDVMMDWKRLADIILDGKPEAHVPTWNWHKQSVWWNGNLVPLNDPDYAQAKKAFDAECLRRIFENLGFHFEAKDEPKTDREKLVAKIITMQEQTVARGRTVQEAASWKLAAQALIKKHDVTQAEINIMRNKLKR